MQRSNTAMGMQRRHHQNNKKSMQIRYGEDGQTPMLTFDKLFPEKNNLNPDLNLNLQLAVKSETLAQKRL